MAIRVSAGDFEVECGSPADAVEVVRLLTQPQQQEHGKSPRKIVSAPAVVAIAPVVKDASSIQVVCDDPEELAYIRRQENIEMVMACDLRDIVTMTNNPGNSTRIRERDCVQVLLRGLCDEIVEPLPEKQARGRPRIQLSDLVYAGTMKVYSMVSGRNADREIRRCHALGLIKRAPCYNSVFRCVELPGLAPLLSMLVTKAAAPMVGIEREMTATVAEFVTAHGKVKVAATVGAETSVIVAVRAVDGAHDESARRVPDVSFTTIEASTRFTEAWVRLQRYFSSGRTDLLALYRQRDVADAFDQVKGRFGRSLHSKLATAQTNEVLFKCLCHNLVVLAYAIDRLSIKI
jgi:hypothetical protein